MTREEILQAVKDKKSLEDANLWAANLCGANLEDANLKDANLVDANLVGANLVGANLKDANLVDANLVGANLKDANLVDANLWGANLVGANLVGANLVGANLRGANLGGANLNQKTILPTGETFAVFTSEVVPALLTAGGKSLAVSSAVWDCHSWENCPLHAAFDAKDISAVPPLLRPRAEQFLQLFDAGLLPAPQLQGG